MSEYQQVNGLATGIKWDGNWIAKTGLISVTEYEDFEVYNTSSLVTGSNFGYGWESSWISKLGTFLGITENEDFQNYISSSGINGLNSGSIWTGSWVGKIGTFLGVTDSDNYESYISGSDVAGLNGGTGWGGGYMLGTLLVPSIYPSFQLTLPATMSISSSVSASIYYTIDGSIPTTASLLYTGSFILSNSATIIAIASQSGYLNSPTASATYPTPGIPVSSSLVAWWESNYITGLNDGDVVSTWSDFSGYGRHATSGAGPTYKINIFGTKPALLFDGGNHLLAFSASGLPNFTVFQVYKPNSAGSYNVATITWCAASGDRSGFALNGQDRHITTFNSVGSETNNKVMGSPALVAGTKHILTWTYNGTTLVSRDNSASLSNSSGDGGYGATNGIGWSYNYFSGYLASIVVYNRVLSGSEINSVENYLNEKYPCF